MFPAYLRGIETGLKVLGKTYRDECSQPTYEGLKPAAHGDPYIVTGQFPAYLRGIETPYPDPSRYPWRVFPAYLRGIETSTSNIGMRQARQVPSLPTRD